MTTRPPVSVEAAQDVSEGVARKVAEILQREQVGRAFAEAPIHRVRAEAVLPPGITLAAAHATWLPRAFPNVATLPPFPAQPIDVPIPDDIVRVSYEFEREPSGGMSSHFGFKGHFVSLLVSLAEGCIWDARVEESLY